MGDEIYDVAIVGAGPAGLTSALYCGRSGISTILFGNVFESQIAKAGKVENYLGFESIQGIDLIEKFNEQVSKYKITTVPMNVTRISKGETFTLYAGDLAYRGRAIIMATGSKVRELHIPGEKELTYKGVSYCAICDGTLYKEKKVALVGHGDQAAKAALYLAGLCSEVDVLTDSPDIDSPLYGSQIVEIKNVVILAGAIAQSIEGKEYVERIRYRIGAQPEKTMDVEAVFIEGGAPNSVLAGELGLELDPKSNVKVNRPEQSTNIEGVFAAGDLTSGIHQISKASGEGAEAAISATMYVRKKLKGDATHSK